MFRDLLSSRLSQAGFAFFVLVVGGSLLYSWHVHRTTAAEFGTIPQTVESPKNKTEANTAPVDFQTEGVVNTPDETTETLMSEAETIDATELLDIADAFLPDDMVSEAEASAEDVPVSPYGFGPYPEVPVDYPYKDPFALSIGGCSTKELELIERVLIKLWNQGNTNITGGFFMSGKVYPHYSETAYTRQTGNSENGGFMYIGSPDFPEPDLESIQSGKIKGQLRDLDSSGIEPYSFLGLDRSH